MIGRRLAGGRPVLGICVGMQVLFERGVEHGVETEGCDEWPGVVERLQAPVVPHMGWNTVEAPDGIARCSPASRASGSTSCTPTASGAGTLETHGRTRAPLVTWAEHGGDRFVAAVENGPLCGDPVPPREVRRRRRRAAAQLGGEPVSPPMSKERAQRRAEREREAAVGRRPAREPSAAPAAARTRT